MKKSPLEIAKDTLEIISKGFYRNPLGETVDIRNEIELAVEKSTLLTGQNPEIGIGDLETKIVITDETTLEAAKRLTQKENVDNPFVLNFANAKTPGGGFLSGAIAQEESLARSSAIYPTLTKYLSWYESNRRVLDQYYSDDMIYSPEVPVFRNDNGSLLLDPYSVAFLTSPAVNTAELKRHGNYDRASIEFISQNRIRKILATALQFGHRDVILGAWGCGVFGNEPEMIANLFAVSFESEFRNKFERVVFAVYDKGMSKKTLGAFQNRFAES